MLHQHFVPDILKDGLQAAKMAYISHPEPLPHALLHCTWAEHTIDTW
jgi:hypothetical protein